MYSWYVILPLRRVELNPTTSRWKYSFFEFYRCWSWTISWDNDMVKYIFYRQIHLRSSWLFLTLCWCHLLWCETPCRIYQDVHSEILPWGGETIRKSQINLFKWNESQDDARITHYLRGLARSLWPIVTKLVSWYDMNHAREETLQYSRNITSFIVPTFF